MGKHFISVLAAIACALMAACAQPSGPGYFSAPQADGISWKWRSNDAFPRTVVLTLHHGYGATLETWDALQASGSEASYRIETGDVGWVYGHQLVTFNGREQQPLEIHNEPDGSLSAWWHPAGQWSASFANAAEDPPATEPDMRMQRVYSPESSPRPVDLP